MNGRKHSHQLLQSLITSVTGERLAKLSRTLLKKISGKGLVDPANLYAYPWIYNNSSPWS